MSAFDYDEEVKRLLTVALSGQKVTTTTRVTSGKRAPVTTTEVKIEQTPDLALKSLLVRDVLSGGELGLFNNRRILTANEPIDNLRRPKRRLIEVNSELAIQSNNNEPNK